MTETAVLDGFTITGGQANGQAFPDTVGGGRETLVHLDLQLSNSR